METKTTETSVRYIGIVPRVKKTKDGEARQTLMTIVMDGNIQAFELETEQFELDFVKGCMPIKWRKVIPCEDLSSFKKHHIMYHFVKKGEDVTAWQEDVNVLRNSRKEITDVPDKVPTHYIGLSKGDVVGMMLGGSGDNFAFALSRQAEKIGAKVFRIPPFLLKDERGNDDKIQDSVLLAKLVETKQHLFYEVLVRDRSVVKVRETLRARMDAMKARIACEQRLRQRIIGEIFCSEEGLYPEGGIEKYFDDIKANDVILGILQKEENGALKRLEKAVEATDVFQKVLNPIEGCGAAIASRIVASITDIRSFKTAPKLKKFMGVHVLPDGTFPRRRNDECANWKPDARQALYLLADQFNRRPDSEWGEYFLLCKKRLRTIHPEPVVSRKEFSQLWRSIDRFFRRREVVVFPKLSKVETIDQFYSFFHAGVVDLNQKETEPSAEVQAKIREFEEKINALGEGGKSVTIFTPGHIHKMAIWRCLSRFVEWLFVAWWKLEKSNSAPAEVQKAA